MGSIVSLVISLISVLPVLAVLTALRFTWTHTKPWLQGDLGLQRYMHATKGKAAWAFVTHACDPVGQALSYQLAARGFNVAMHGSDRPALDAMKGRLEREFPWNRYRVVAERADAGAESVVDEVFVARVAAAMDGGNLTVLVNNATTAPGQAPGGDVRNLGVPSPAVTEETFAMRLAAALIPLLRRNAPALVVNLASVTAPEEMQMPLCPSCGAPTACARDGINVVSYRLGGLASGDERPSLFTPSTETLACAALRYAGVGHGGDEGWNYTFPYWPHAMLYMKDEALPGWASELARNVWERGKKLKI
ncbi:hypothetical protein GGR53DRAFT_284137 [Hypoxylon sp. FL1150]|nr:hypothetical protein GGR53DRAFT_284137 [Hypoxylon sp. FL1150]